MSDNAASRPDRPAACQSVALRDGHTANFNHVVWHVGRIHYAMQELVSHPPLAVAALQRYRLVVQTKDAPGSLLLIAIYKAHDLADGNLVSTQTLLLVFPDLHIGVVEIDRRIRNDPAPGIVQIQDDRVLAAHFKDAAAPERIGLRIKILDLLPYTQPGLNGQQPSRFIKHAVDGRAQSKKLKR